jgi:hypothetical protein
VTNHPSLAAEEKIFVGNAFVGAIDGTSHEIQIPPMNPNSNSIQTQVKNIIVKTSKGQTI